MTLAEILDIAREASPDAWEIVATQTIHSWGYGEKHIDGIDGLVPYVEPTAHHTRAIYKGDIDVSLAWGATHQPDYHAPWMPKSLFSDPSISSIYIDLRYRGQVVQNWIMIYLDGSRILIPTPDLVPGTGEDEDNPMRWYVMRRSVEYARRFAALVVSGDTKSGDRTETALARIGIEIH